MADETTTRTIRQFFAGDVVLLTGASGFLGRMTLEKLLRSCPEVQKVYVILRPKKDKDIAKRLEELLDSVVFQRLNKEQPNFYKKIHLLAGDCALPDLGLLPEAKKAIVSEVNVIIHWAATVKFDENLKTATNINVRAVRDLIRMAKTMPQLKAFLHVSTAFSQCVHATIDEIFYETPVGGGDLVQMMEALDAKTADDITPSLLGRWPNTYVFTKAVAENLIMNEVKAATRDHSRLPIGILRPSIVIGSYKEPVPGWIDNYYGATGILVGCAVGLIRIVNADLSSTAEMVPADYVVNAAIAALPDIHRKHNERTLKMAAHVGPPASPSSVVSTVSAENSIPIYNYVSSAQKCITWEIFMELAQKHCMKIPSPMIIWYSMFYCTANTFLYNLGIFFLHTLPAYVVDFIATCLGKKPLLVKGYQKIHKFGTVLAYFSRRSWTFHNGNVQLLWNHLDDDDKVEFNFNMGAFDWNEYFPHYVLGARLYLLKDPIETLAAGRRKFLKLQVLHYALVTFLFYGLYKLINVFLSLF